MMRFLTFVAWALRPIGSGADQQALSFSYIDTKFVLLGSCKAKAIRKLELHHYGVTKFAMLRVRPRT